MIVRSVQGACQVQRVVLKCAHVFKPAFTWALHTVMGRQCSHTGFRRLAQVQGCVKNSYSLQTALHLKLHYMAMGVHVTHTQAQGMLLQTLYTMYFSLGLNTS